MLLKKNRDQIIFYFDAEPVSIPLDMFSGLKDRVWMDRFQFVLKDEQLWPRLKKIIWPILITYPTIKSTKLIVNKDVYTINLQSHVINIDKDLDLAFVGKPDIIGRNSILNRFYNILTSYYEGGIL